MDLALNNRLDQIARQRIAMGAGRRSGSKSMKRAPRRRRGAGVLIDDMYLGSMPMYQAMAPTSLGQRSMGRGVGVGGVGKCPGKSLRRCSKYNTSKKPRVCERDACYSNGSLSNKFGRPIKAPRKALRPCKTKGAYHRCEQYDTSVKPRRCKKQVCYVKAKGGCPDLSYYGYGYGGDVKNKEAAQRSPWIKYVRDYATYYQVPYACALIEAAPDYRDAKKLSAHPVFSPRQVVYDELYDLDEDMLFQ